MLLGILLLESCILFFVDLATIFSQLQQEVDLKKLDKNGIILET